MTNFLFYFHSGLRYLILALFVLVIIISLIKWLRKSDFSKLDQILVRASIGLFHLQIVTGLILYFIEARYQGFSDMGNKVARIYALEHPLGMIIVAAFLGIGSKRLKLAIEGPAKHKLAVMVFLLAIIITYLSIPWPWRLS